MTLAQDLENLQQQRRHEVHTLHQTYLRTKRTILRTASPERILRRHMGLSLTLAAAFGLLLAPRPAPQTSTGKPAHRAKAGLASSLGWIKKKVHPFFPSLANYIPDLPHEEPAPEPNAHENAARENESPPPKHSRHLLRTLLIEGATLLLSKLDFRKIFHDLLHALMPDRDDDQDNECCGTSCECDQPNVSVADVGTVQPSDYENFE